MKTINKTILLGCISATLFSCNDGFMERYPETEITPKVFFLNVGDLETYTNGLYDLLDPSYNDVVSDNSNTTDDDALHKLMRGDVTPKNAGQWNWENLYRINYLIEHYGTAVGDQADINHFVGVARLFRAYEYYKKVKSFSDVPWFSRTLSNTDVDLLYKPQDSRALVVDSIMADLEYAVKWIKDTDTKTCLTRWAALHIQARIALEEGTFRKYHDELGLKDADRFLQIARDASKEIIEKGSFSLYTEKAEQEPYEALFRSLDLSRNPEMIMYTDYDKALNRMHNAQAQFNYNSGLSRDLQEDYLALKDGKAVPFHEIAGYDKMSLTDLFKNRDPRLNYTFMQPGYVRAGEQQPSIPRLALGGYPQVKFEPHSYDQMSWEKSYTDLPLMRLGETYLIYAEARAELGELTQADLDLTINKLRSRVNMPPMELGQVLAEIDPMQEQRYANVTGSMKGAILEIRRERRVELACEGYRKGDIYRWKVGTLLAKNFDGIYVGSLGYMDLTGDGQPDVAIVATTADADKIPAADKEKYKLTVYVLEGNTFYLSEGDHGYVRMTSHKNKFSFVEPKYYYSPVSESDLITSEINGSATLIQNKYWN